jgi:hypothetical protein
MATAKKPVHHKTIRKVNISGILPQDQTQQSYGPAAPIPQQPSYGPAAPIDGAYDPAAPIPQQPSYAPAVDAQGTLPPQQPEGSSAFAPPPPQPYYPDGTPAPVIPLQQAAPTFSKMPVLAPAATAAPAKKKGFFGSLFSVSKSKDVDADEDRDASVYTKRTLNDKKEAQQISLVGKASNYKNAQIIVDPFITEHKNTKITKLDKKDKLFV